MTPNQRLMLDRLEYPYKGLLFDIAEVVGPFVVLISVGLIVLSILQGYAQDRAKAHCDEIAAYYGVAADSDPSHRMLPPGVSIEYKAGSCIRTDNLTTMTGNER